MRLRTAIVCVVGAAITQVAISPVNAIVALPADGVGAAYWWTNSVVYCEVISVKDERVPNAIGYRAEVAVRPIGTLSGRFDPGKLGQLCFDLSFPTSFDAVPVDGRDAIPSPKQKMLIVLETGLAGQRNWRNGSFVRYMPGSYGFPHRIISGFSDPEVSNTFAKIKLLRRQDDFLSKRTWRMYEKLAPTRVVVLGTVTKGPATLAPESDVDLPAFTINVSRVLSGENVGRSIHSVFRCTVCARQFESEFTVPSVQSQVIATLDDRPGAGDPNRYIIPDEPVGFMPGDHSPICEIHGLDDPRVADTVKAIDVEKYWANHCVVCATITRSRETVSRNVQAAVLHPEMTLSGSFDAAKMPRLVVTIPQKGIDALKVQSAKANALVLLERHGDNYIIGRDGADFMPANHAPIALVKDFDDTAVNETLHRIRILRNSNTKCPPPIYHREPK